MATAVQRELSAFLKKKRAKATQGIHSLNLSMWPKTKLITGDKP